MRKLAFLLLNILCSFSLTAQTTHWVLSFGGMQSDKGISIGTDSLGFIYVSGFYNSEATFDTITLSNGTLDSFDKTSSTLEELFGFSLTFKSIVTVFSIPLIISLSNFKSSLSAEKKKK